MVPLLLLLFLSISFLIMAAADPQTNLLSAGCSPYNVTGPFLPFFFGNVNASIADIRNHILKNTTTSFTPLPTNYTPTPYFSTAEYTRNSSPVYVLFQCRDYLTIPDCLSCLDAAAVQIRRNCTIKNGARVQYDGCFLRYESRTFYDQAGEKGQSNSYCNPRSPSRVAGFSDAAGQLMTDLAEAVPKITGRFSAAAVSGSSNNNGSSSGAPLVYGVAQCVRTTTSAKCADCLKIALDSMRACLPADEARAIDAGCFMRYSARPFFSLNQTDDLPTILAVGNNNTGSVSKTNKAAIIGGAAGGATGALLFSALLFLLWFCKFRQSTTDRRGDILGATELQGPVNFHYKDLKKATKSFSEENKLGKGGFGDVYKGVLRNGKIVAVKKLFIGASSRVLLDFKTEVTLISNVHHRNLIRLLGCARKGFDLLLVYEYMANSSLDKFLFGEKQVTLNWKKRFDIIVGTARGLAYLHDEYHVCIIHRDIKSSNILLDDDFQPKIADFGLARLLPNDQTHLTTKFAGTLGYTAPEYAVYGQLSEKVDTFSYGVVVLEIISGRKSTDASLEPASQYLLEWAWMLYEEGSLLNLVDQTLGEDYDKDEIKKLLEIALLCTQSNVAARPTMSQVVIMLLGNSMPTTQPAKPSFIEGTNRMLEGAPRSLASSSSVTHATVSISQVSGR